MNGLRGPFALGLTALRRLSAATIASAACALVALAEPPAKPAAPSLADSAPPPITGTVEVKVDLATDLGPMKRVGSGFLHAIEKNRPPRDQAKELYKPLKVRFYRGFIDQLAEYHQREPEAALVSTFSGGWGYPRSGQKDLPPPWVDNWSKWDALVVKYVEMNRDQGIHPIYDTYNEPNLREWFGGWAKNQYAPGWEGATFEKFCELHLRTYRLVRKLDPKAETTAPGFGYPELDGMPYLRKFKDFCVANDCVPDYWNWHFGGDHIPAHAAEVLSWKLNKGVFITEYLGPNESIRPGRVAYELALLEKSGVTGAMKANWPKLDQKFGTYNGLFIDKGTAKWGKRSPWYVYRTLALMDGRQVAASSSMSQISVLASHQPKGNQLLVLLGNSFVGRGRPGLGAAAAKNAGFEGKVTLSIAGLASLGKDAKVRLERIPFNDNKELAAMPAPILDETMPIRDGTVVVNFDWQSRDDAYRLSVSPANPGGK